MARSGRSKKGRGMIRRWLFRMIALAVLVVAGFAAWLWWDMRSWRPDVALYPEQGAVVAAGQFDVNFTTLNAIGAGFVYLRLERMPQSTGIHFAASYERALKAGMQVGILSLIHI